MDKTAFAAAEYGMLYNSDLINVVTPSNDIAGPHGTWVDFVANHDASFDTVSGYCKGYCQIRVIDFTNLVDTGNVIDYSTSSVPLYFTISLANNTIHNGDRVVVFFQNGDVSTYGYSQTFGSNIPIDSGHTGLNDNSEYFILGSSGSTAGIPTQNLYPTGTEPTEFTSYSISTSTQTFIVNGNIKATDLANGVHLSFNVSTPIYPNWDNEDIVATTSGPFTHSFIYQNFSTSTLPYYTFTSSLYKPTTDTFGSSSAGFVLYDTVSTTTDALGLGTTTAYVYSPSSSSFIMNALCNPFINMTFSISPPQFSFNPDFSFGVCMNYLFLKPDPIAMHAAIQSAQQGFLTAWPVGYINRILLVTTGSATTSLPLLSYTFQSDSPYSGKTLSFDTASYFTQAASISNSMTSNTDHKNVWQIMEPIVDLIIYLMVIFAMIHDIMGIKLTHK